MSYLWENLTPRSLHILFLVDIMYIFRTLNPCSHVQYALYALGVVAHNPGVYTTQWHKTAYVDLGQNPDFSDELLAEVFQ
jgi:hypothetical protein